MLVRSGGRRHRHHTSQILAASFAQLNLPWLAPAQLRWSASQASTSQRTPRSPGRLCKSRIRPIAHHTRHLATVTDPIPSRYDGQYPPPGYSNAFKNSSQDRNVPWDLSAQPKVSGLRPYDDPIIINTTLQTPAPLIKVQNGIHGTKIDLLQHLHTSLRVSRPDRAVAIIHRLAEQCAPDSPEMLHAHTAYLEEQLRILASHGRDNPRSQETLKQMQRWFEVEVRNKGIQPDAKLLVVMVRAAIRSLQGSSRDRSIRRYADLAKSVDLETYDELLYSEDYDDNEFTILGRVTSEFYEDSSDVSLQTEAGLEAPSAQKQSFQRQDVLPLDNVPDVMPTDQKGEGLSSIKRAMRTFIDLPPLPSDAPLEAQRERAYTRQQLMEETSVEIAVERWRKADEELRKIGIHTAMQSKPVAALMWQWYQSLLPALEKELTEAKRMLAGPGKNDDDRLLFGPYLELLPIQRVAANTILHTMACISNGKNHDSGKYETEVKLNALTIGIGKAIEQECAAEANRKKAKKEVNGWNSIRMRKSMFQQLKRKDQRKLQQQQKKSGLSKEDILASMSWPLSVKVKLGAMLSSKLIESAQLPVTRDHPRTKERITQMQPAFLHRIKYHHGKKVGVVTPNPALVEKIESEPVGSLIAKRMPMVVEPKPWSGWNEGGYLHYSNEILRLGPGDNSGKDYFLAAHRNGDMEQVYAGLTALGKVPWKINHDVFKVQLEAWNSGDKIANFAPLHPQLDIPPEPAQSSDPSPRRKWLSEIRDIENKRAGLHSKRCFQNFQLEIARAVVNEKLYLPHNMDFRGRAYPIPPYLNHMGADNVRGLLTFADGKELGPEGLRWLKIHLATVAGHDKASLEERIEFTRSHLDDIYDSVRHPLNGRRWWLKAEDAWQTLAACFELTKAMDSSDPETFVSYLPIQQDGTCNGLQHYAALGGDVIGAQQVNLEPGDRPADVYTAVAEAVKEEIRQDAAEGNPVAQKLDGRITRKCVKQPVMTNVYGVTFYGAKEQVRRQLEVLFPEVRRFDPINLEHLSHYIATKIFKSLGTMFRGAQAIQHWLGQCADRISMCITPEQIKLLTTPGPSSEKKALKQGRKGSKTASAMQEAEVVSSNGSATSDKKAKDSAKPLFKSTVVWTTPLRLPVVQPYRASKSRLISTTLQNLYLQEPQVWDPVSKRKQLQGFPPNFIHSLDATHMLLSVLRCSEVGMTFASIHDSFWTHARDVNALNTVLRDAFVEMHSDNVIGRLREEFQMRYKGCMYMASVLARSPVGVKITRWRQGQSSSTAKSTELALEAERMRLINSEDARERKRGEEMVTPGSIFASEGDDSAFAVPTEITGQTLGDIPSGATHTEEQASTADVEATNTDANADARQAESMDTEGIVSGSVMDTDTESLAESASNVAAGEMVTAAKSKSQRTSQAKKYPRKLQVWLPMSFPEVPAKGGFDVTRLRASKYFFH